MNCVDILLDLWDRGDVTGDGGLLGQSTVGDGGLSEECSFSVSAGTHEAVLTLSSSGETRGCSLPMSLISLAHDDFEKTPTDQGQRRSQLHFRLAHGCHVQHMRSGIWAVQVVYTQQFSWD